MNWYKVLVAHEGRPQNSEFAAEGDLRMLSLEQMGLVVCLGVHDDPIVAEQQDTVANPKRSRRGKSAKAGSAGDQDAQSPTGVEARDAGVPSDRGVGESDGSGSSAE